MPQDPTPFPLEPERLTWAALLGRWVDFARSATALPNDAAGRRLKASVPDIIMLQAVWFALQDLGDLPPEQRALGLDRAGVLIEKHGEAIEARWGDEPLPEQLLDLLRDAREQWRAAQTG